MYGGSPTVIKTQDRGDRVVKGKKGVRRGGKV
jgi:hypothetical protein